MHTAEAELLTDTEGEEALLVLGAQLTWRLVADAVWHGRLDGSDDYSIHYSEKFHLSFACACHHEAGPSRSCGTLTAAKLACERHHATGKWE